MGARVQSHYFPSCILWGIYSGGVNSWGIYSGVIYSWSYLFRGYLFMELFIHGGVYSGVIYSGGVFSGGVYSGGIYSELFIPGVFIHGTVRNPCANKKKTLPPPKIFARYWVITWKMLSANAPMLYKFCVQNPSQNNICFWNFLLVTVNLVNALLVNS